MKILLIIFLQLLVNMDDFMNASFQENPIRVN
jgi:hypothetical protein